ncbi:MAG TPA: ABC transporter ATP-binding protein [Syntrophales bacterium]|nr:ABC transporter ATP-binding protein [Syntrophales bacterium]
MLLHIDNITTYYGKGQALRGVSLTVDEGEIVALLGANGAGKSTTLLTISGIVRPHEGTITYRDKMINKEKSSEIVKMGIAHCPEGRALFPDMTVQDNLELGAFLRRDKDGIQEDLEGVYHHFPRLKERLKQLAGSLSGGEQQMLAIGRALMSRPVLLMMDEPSLGLSPILVDEMFEIINDINKEGISVLLVEQNVGATLEVADRGYVIENGRVTFSGTREELVNNDDIRKAYLGG